MAFWFHCPNCRSNRIATDAVVGQEVLCPDCNQVVAVETPHAASMIPDSQLEKTPGKILNESSIVAPKVKTHVARTIPVVAVPLEKSEGDFDEEIPPPLFERREREETEMDMTPMVDVTFLLLIFFMVTASFTMQKAMSRPTDASDEPSMVQTEEEEDDPDLVQVDIDEFNSFFVVASESEPIEAPSKQDLLIALREAKQGGTGAAKRLLIRAHVDSYHERTVTAMDVGTDLDYQMQVQIVEEL